MSNEHRLSVWDYEKFLETEVVVSGAVNVSVTVELYV